MKLVKVWNSFIVAFVMALIVFAFFWAWAASWNWDLWPEDAFMLKLGRLIAAMTIVVAMFNDWLEGKWK